MSKEFRLNMVVLPVLDTDPRDPMVVAKYIGERGKKEEMRIKVLARFNKAVDRVMAISGNRRIKGMSINTAINEGTKLIMGADYPFLLELRNVRNNLFLSTLFDTVIKH